MCGFAATVDLSGSGMAVPWALDLLRHRGPDGEGVVTAPGVALEHCRLAIIDAANPEADQPFSDPSGRWTIVYNGEIFNYRELRARLERRGVAFRTRSDTEVVLLGFVHEGERILDELRGMFAFAIWDSERRELFAARDQVGVKPLYYLESGSTLALSSEIRPLLAHPGFRPELDPAAVVSFLAFGKDVGERTLVEGVRRLLPGHWLRAREGRVAVGEYWDVLSPTPDLIEPDPTELRTLVQDSVRASLVSDVPLGLMLSGGIDSSAIAALASREVPPSTLTAYSVSFGQSDDESEAAAELARELGLRHRVITLTEHDLRGDFESWLAELDYPSSNPTWIASSFIARAARADGIKVLLSGDGGDELFGGYNRWMKYLRFHDTIWGRTPRGLRRVAGTLARPFARGLAGDIARRARAGGDLFVPSRPFHDDLLGRTLGRAGRSMLAAEAPEARIEGWRRRLDERMPGADYLAWISYVSFKTTLVEDYLQRLDKMGMRHSVEGRVPLLDPQLARWAFRVPQAAKVPGLRQKALLRDAVAPLLPDYVMRRPKQGFCPPVAAWAERLLFGRSLFAGGPLVESGLVEPDAARALISRGNAKDAFAAWTLGMLAEWTNRNLSGAAAPSLATAAAA